MRNAQKVVIKTLTSREVLGEYLHIPFHEAGSAANKAGVRGTVISSIDTAEDGDYTTNPGYMTLTGTQSAQLTGDAIAAFMSLNTVEHQMLVGIRIYPDVAPNGWIWGASPFATQALGYGGYGAQYSNLSSGKCKWQASGTATADLANAPTLTENAAGMLLFVFDVENLTFISYLNGVAGQSAALTGALPVCMPDIGLGVGGRPAVGSVENELQNTIAISDFWMLRTASDLSADVPAIAKDWSNHPLELPSILRAR
jgi:hypothetical protein